MPYNLWMSDTSEKKEKKDYDFGEVEVSTFEEIKKQYSSGLGTYQIYAYIPASPSCDGNNSPVDPC
jgi:hypothetical protein